MENEKSASTDALTVDVLTIEDPAAAAALTNPRTLRQLEPFLNRERTVLEAARESGVKPNTILSRVKRFVNLGLLVVVREEARAGRAVKVWGRISCHDGRRLLYNPRYELMPSAT